MAHKLRETSEALFAGPESLPNKPVASETKEEGKEDAATAAARHRKKGQLPCRSDSISSQVIYINYVYMNCSEANIVKSIFLHFVFFINFNGICILF